MSNEVVVPDRKTLAGEAADYRRQGASYAAIAEQMNIPVSEVVALVSEHAQSVPLDLRPETTLKMDIERIEIMMNAIFSDAANGDLNAIERVSKLMKERQELEAKAPASAAALFG